eukprot:TRINITY_DN4212_c0_g1_i1.p1 TRINITY_DN4212_c0_g1~~TRINITY_DN4212_c0_g1_i1.p1  ORF type:complete len:303 (-),score=58.37 TRINITY_DN4212_c0_g1_i1:919-1806(-)
MANVDAKLAVLGTLGVGVTLGLGYLLGKYHHEPVPTKREIEIFKGVEDPAVKKAWNILKTERDELLAQVEEGSAKAKKVIEEIKLEREELLSQLLDKVDRWELTYFDAKGRAEQIRLLFAECGVNYNDERLTREQWAARKATTPFGSLPLLSHNGKVIGESIAQLVYVAKLHDRWPKSSADEAVAFSIICFAEDLRSKYYEAYFAPENDKATKLTNLRNFLTEKLPCAERFVETGFVVAHRLTAADIALWDVLDQITSFDTEATNEIISRLPLLDGWRKRIAQLPNVQKYLETRK